MVVRPTVHEISIMQGTLDLALHTAQQSGATQIQALRLRVGAMTGVVPEALQFAFEALREGTIAAAARLDIQTISASYWCPSCQTEFESRDWLQECPHCRRPGAELRHGLELELASIDVN
jgi:hydrogenase nickel incorporation protein HypA/HybF